MELILPFHMYQQKYHYKYLALYHALHDAILSGLLPYESKLPSTRDLAQLYQLSRGVVNQVYDMLCAEGYLATETGRGTFVTYRSEECPRIGDAQEIPPILSEWGKRMNQLVTRKRVLEKAVEFDFTIGYPDLQHFPIEEWHRVLYAAVRDFTYTKRDEAFSAQGHLPLRSAIANHLRRFRGIDCSPEEIVIVNGSMQAIAILAQLLINPGDSVVIENPCYTGMIQAIQATGGIALPNSVDQSGISIANWPSRLLFTTPSRQFPTGRVLSIERRLRLLQWAAKNNAYIIEDDYDSEFRYHGRPIEPLKVLDSNQRVVYIGTFSKTLLPDIRTGYVVLPSALIEPFIKAKQLFEPHPTGLIEQKAIAYFMSNGQYEKHLRKMNRVYREKYEFLFEQVKTKLSSFFHFIESNAGLHIFGKWVHSVEEYNQLCAACRSAGIKWTDAAPYFIENAVPSACFGFSHLSLNEISEGTELIKQVIFHNFAGTD
jgi:GntR family transcriptional regulator / MocR family aminotransferase